MKIHIISTVGNIENLKLHKVPKSTLLRAVLSIVMAQGHRHSHFREIFNVVSFVFIQKDSVVFEKNSCFYCITGVTSV